MNSIVVTGATSMIGVALIEAALENRCDVYAIVRKNTKRLARLPKSDKLHIVYADLPDLNEVRIPPSCDALYHFAWAGTSKSDRDDPEIQEQNIRYTLDAVNLACRTGCGLFVGAGSQAEYGPVRGCIDQNTRFAPVISYGAAKLAAGILSRKLCEKLGLIHAWGRIFSVYGRYDNQGTMLDYAIRQFLAGDTADFSPGLQMWNYLNERDAGRLFYQIGEKTKAHESYLIASGENKRLREYIMELAGCMDSESLCRFAPDDGIQPPGLYVDASKTFQALGMEPLISFKDGIREMVNAYRA